MRLNTGCSLAPLCLLRFEASALEYWSTVLSELYTSYEFAATVRCVLLMAQACRALRESCCTATHTARRLLGALRRQARGSRRLWQLGARSLRRTLAHLPAGTLHSTVYTTGYNSKV